jgi:hypothetical protein
VHERLKSFGQQVEAFRSIPMANGRLARYFNRLLPAIDQNASQREKDNRQKAVDQLNANFGNEMNTLPGMRGTIWAALNAATEFADHQRRFRGNGDVARRESRLDSIWFGSSNEFKQSAYQSALELARLN